MLNDVVIMEAARHLANSTLQVYGVGDRDIASEMFRRCVTRSPDDVELSRISTFYQQQLKRLRANPDQTFSVLNSGPSQIWNSSEGMTDWVTRANCQARIIDSVWEVVSEGEDPILGVKHSAPPGNYTLNVNAKFGTTGVAEIYWTTKNEAEESVERRVVFQPEFNEWRNYSVAFQAPEGLESLRLDVGQSAGSVEIREIKLDFGDGLFQLSSSVDPQRLAAWTLVARALFNLDETITKP
jgi:hypothetical protein